MRIFLLFTVFFISLHAVRATDNLFRVSIQGKEYEELDLRVAVSGLTSEIIRGDRKTPTTWEFHVPDSIYERHVNMSLVVPSVDTLVHQFVLSDVAGQDTLSTMQFSISPGESHYELHYFRTKTQKKVSYMNNRDVIYDYYVVKTSDPEFQASLTSLHSLFGFFRESTYEESLEKYISLVKQYENSHIWMAALYSTLNKYKTKEDLREVFSHFSSGQKNSYYGRLIQDYINVTVFSNIQLPRIDTRQPEDVILNSDTYHLIVFTASWCAPCHQLIPLLKEIHNDLQDSLTITYISIDEAGRLEKWAELLQEHEIPWRCLYAADKLDEVMALYTVKGIPLAYYVHPDKSFEKVELRKKEDRDILYKGR